jgi:hypothetical protein
MHGPIRDNLEKLLNSNESDEGARSHLAACADCRNELSLMKEQSALLAALRAPEGVEPSAGFYARVLQKIDEQSTDSVWSAFTNGSFGKWLVYASLAIALLLGTWIVGAEQEDGHMGASAPVIAKDASSDMPVTGDQAHQRDVVLVNLAAYSQSSE